MTRQQLVAHIRAKRSYLCVGLDTDLAKIPRHLLSDSDPVFAFNKAIIDATRDTCVSYKINTAFYEAMGLKGWEARHSGIPAGVAKLRASAMLHALTLNADERRYPC